MFETTQILQFIGVREQVRNTLWVSNAVYVTYTSEDRRWPEWSEN
jgi:hypothetical protein